ncbi:hypothetical protein E8E13_009921 [Curvularia kusanoi]|uniref:AB hydrolase-1 domain-containing protein n=1 Tax=Curvularia kusanoi TaxID=90978 RepID=A0A9P4TNX6_CURKU|nr:hypothetical protein E8E13_009921 [Curvularia kusanoi]
MLEGSVFLRRWKQEDALRKPAVMLERRQCFLLLEKSECTQTKNQVNVCWSTVENPVANLSESKMNQTFSSLSAARPRASSYPVSLAQLQATATPTTSLPQSLPPSSLSSATATATSSSPSSESSASPEPSTDNGSNKGLSGGAIGGIVGGVVGGLALLGVAGFLLFRRRKANSKGTHAPIASGPPSEPEEHGGNPYEMNAFQQQQAGMAEAPPTENYSPLDQLARQHHVRIIHPDKPGLGGSNPVPIEDRIPAYTAMIPQLLDHLGIRHVSLASHSFGTIYLINTLLLYPHLLHPQRPYVAFFAPWVHPNHTGIKHLQAAEMLPAGMIGHFSSLAKFVNGSILPLVGMSSGISSAVSSGVKASLPQSIAPEFQTLAAPARVDRPDNGSDLGGIDLNNKSVVEELRNLIPTFLFAEGVDGAGQDAQLCLRKPRSVPWCTASRQWDDVDDAVRQFKDIIRDGNDQDVERRAWLINTFHAESDSMVGKKGQVWFDDCWNGDESPNSSAQYAMRYGSQIVQDSDHDILLDPLFGASEAWLKGVSEAFRGNQ